MCLLPCSLGASTSWNPQSLSRPVMGLLYVMEQRTASESDTQPGKKFPVSITESAPALSLSTTGK